MPHQRRKSGHLSANNSATDVRKAVTATDPTKFKRPVMPRRHTPVSAQKLGRSQRERERAWQETWDDERESFPQYCMTCDKQFVPQDDMFLYCSETCRRVDQESTSPGVSVRNYSGGIYSISSASSSEPKDIIPRASPSRPGSMLFGSSPPDTPGVVTGKQPTSAVAALRSLTLRPPSPPSPTGSGSSIWPFSRSAADSPLNSYTRPSAPYSATFDGAYNGGYGAGGFYTYDLGSGMSDRPLPSRNPGGAARPRSIELVTPMVGR